jgi:hypothetical protein
MELEKAEEARKNSLGGQYGIGDLSIDSKNTELKLLLSQTQHQTTPY